MAQAPWLRSECAALSRGFGQARIDHQPTVVNLDVEGGVGAHELEQHDKGGRSSTVAWITGSMQRLSPMDHAMPRDGAGGDDARLVEISTPATWRSYISQTWRARDFIWTLARARLRALNQGTALGVLWHLATPMLTAVVFLVVFGYILQISRGVENFPAFLVIGIFIFQYASRTITGGAASLWRETRLISSLKFPRLVLPVTAIVQDTLAFIPALATMMVVVLVTGGGPRLSWLLTLPALLLQGLFVFGLSLITARLAYRFRDIEQVLPFLLRMWLYLSGVFYGAELVEQRAGPIMTGIFVANPMFQFIDLNRRLLLGSPSGGSSWLIILGWTAITLLAGLTYFRAGEMDYGHG